MQNLPECLLPALEQLENYQTQIIALEAKTEALNEHLKDLSSKNEKLVTQAKDETEEHISKIKLLEEEKATLRELNHVINEQMQAKSEQVENLEASESILKEENTKVSSQSQEVNEKQALLDEKTQNISKELEQLKAENSTLQAENSALNLVNSAMRQRHEDIQNSAVQESPVLLAELESLKNELKAYQSGNTDTNFLQKENQRLMQRHGEITQEKMQASSKMHAAQDALSGVQNQLDEANRKIQQLEFDHQGLQKLHRNLNDEKNLHVQSGKDLEFEKRALDEQILHQEENIQGLKTEKEMITQELNAERKKADTLTQVINELRIKNEKLKSGGLAQVQAVPTAKEEPEVEALEIKDMSEDVTDIIRIKNTGPSFPGEH